jgi:hypothetical protein
MTEFIVDLPGSPGSLAHLTKSLAAAGINIDALAGWNANAEAVVRLVVNDPESTRRLLDDMGMRFSERHVLTVSIPNRPGALAELTGDLADAGVDIEAIYVTGGGSESLDLAIAVDDHDPARAAIER